MSFNRSLGLYDATMIVAGSMIGSGIFIVSADIARTVGSPALLLLVWAITGVLTLIAALSYGELAGMMPQAGGQYVYLREAFGPMSGFLYGWTLFTVIQTGTIAAVAMAFAKFTSVLIPAVGESHELLAIGGLSINAAQVLAIASILALTALNAGGVRMGSLIQNLFTSTKVIAVVGLALVGLILGVGSDAFTTNMAAFWSTSITLPESGTVLPTLLSQPILILLPALATAMVGSIFSSDAWNNITFIAGEVKQPERTIPRGLAYGVLLVTALYLLTNLAYLSLLPIGGTEGAETVAARGIMYPTNERVGTAAAEMMLGPAGATVMAVLIMISTFGCNNGLILAGARAYWAMAKDRLFFAGAAELNANGVPARGLWMQAAWASALCLSGSYGQLLDYVVFAVLLFYVLSIAGIFRLRRTKPLADRPYKAFGYPFLPALYMIAATAICVVLLVEKTDYTLPGLGIVASGIPVYLFWRSRSAKHV